MRALLFSLAIVAATSAAAGEWVVSEADSFGYRRALVDVDGARLAVVCPPDRAPFAVPVVEPRPDGEGRARLVLGLEIDGVRHEQPMNCSDIICEADLPDTSWEALMSEGEVTIWYDEDQGPTFPLQGSAEALAVCSNHY